jgi:uncharacterized membrane protein
MMTLFAYLLIGSVVAYGVFTILMELSGEIRYVRIDDDRDTEEKVIAGEETSEVALNYLKIAASLEDDDETR